MPSRPSRTRFPRHLVTAVLVAHDGRRWLPDVLEGLAAQHRPPQRGVAVDTGSQDGSADVLAQALGEPAVVKLARETPLGAAVSAGLAAFNGAPPVPGRPNGAIQEWVWVLHDDSAPDPAALLELLRRAEDAPSATVVGPKVVSWDGRRL